MSIAPDPKDVQIATLEARVLELEQELHDQAARTAAVVAESQEKLYWLERWHVDLDKVMARPGAVPALETLKRARSLVRSVRRLRRRLTGS